MTREDLKYRIAIGDTDYDSGDDYLFCLIDEIYDDFKNRTCENCIHMNKEYKIYSFEKESHTKCEELDTIVNGLDFGCNKWEAKTVSTDTKGEEDEMDNQ